MPNYQVQPTCTSWTWLHLDWIEGRIFLGRKSCFHGSDNIQEAGIPRKLAPTIGISVDPRRQNLSTESLSANVARLKEYRARLILFPRKIGQHKKGDASKEEVSGAKDTVSRLKHGLPIVHVHATVEEISKSDMPEPIEGGAYRKLREARSEARNLGKREKRAKEKADEAAAAKK
jgi:large subunit ribosomal protein L13e